MNNSFMVYFLKAYIPVAILFATTQILHILPSAAFVIVCILLSLPSALTLMYIVVLRKTTMSKRLSPDGTFFRMNKRKYAMVIISIPLSFAATFFLLLDVQSWQMWDWVLICVLIPVFYIGFNLVQRIFNKEFNGIYRELYLYIACTVVATAIMLVLYFFCYYFLMDGNGTENFNNAFMYYEKYNRLIDSASPLISEASYLSTILVAIKAYLTGKVTGQLSVVIVIWALIIYASVFLNISGILLCLITPFKRFKRIFIPLSDEVEAPEDEIIQRKYIYVAIGIYVALMIAFVIFEHMASDNYEFFNSLNDHLNHFIDINFNSN